MNDNSGNFGKLFLPKKLLWIDLEMSGLDIEKEVIIDVAAIVTNINLEVLDSYEAVVKQPQKYIDGMDDWNKEHHGKSGLIDKIPLGKEPAAVEAELSALVKKHWPVINKKDDKPVLCGNSIAQDRLFLNKYFRNFSDLLHYRMLDVSSWKIMFQGLYHLKYEKQGTHKAVDDIKESIEELRFYIGHIVP